MARSNQSKPAAGMSVFVGNIPYDVNEDQLRDVFSTVGKVVSMRIVYDRETGKPKGYGFCEFLDSATALSAMRNLNGYEIGGRPLRVDYAEGDKKNEPTKAEAHFDSPVEATEALIQGMSMGQTSTFLRELKDMAAREPAALYNMMLERPALAFAVVQAFRKIGMDTKANECVVGGPANRPPPSSSFVSGSMGQASLSTLSSAPSMTHVAAMAPATAVSQRDMMDAMHGMGVAGQRVPMGGGGGRGGGGGGRGGGAGRGGGRGGGGSGARGQRSGGPMSAAMEQMPAMEQMSVMGQMSGMPGGGMDAMGPGPLGLGPAGSMSDLGRMNPHQAGSMGRLGPMGAMKQRELADQHLGLPLGQMSQMGPMGGQRNPMLSTSGPMMTSSGMMGSQQMLGIHGGHPAGAPPFSQFPPGMMPMGGGSQMSNFPMGGPGGMSPQGAMYSSSSSGGTSHMSHQPPQGGAPPSQKRDPRLRMRKR